MATLSLSLTLQPPAGNFKLGFLPLVGLDSWIQPLHATLP
jgi:hypothetical protein